MNAETAIETSKFAMYVNHIKNNRIEYLVCALIAHTLGLFDRLYSQTNGVCL